MGLNVMLFWQCNYIKGPFRRWPLGIGSLPKKDYGILTGLICLFDGCWCMVRVTSQFSSQFNVLFIYNCNWFEIIPYTWMTVMYFQCVGFKRCVFFWVLSIIKVWRGLAVAVSLCMWEVPRLIPIQLEMTVKIHCRKSISVCVQYAPLFSLIIQHDSVLFSTDKLFL